MSSLRNQTASQLLLRTVLPAALGLLFIAPFCFSLESETDLGWHLAIGRVISQSGIPLRNTLCWTAANEPWYATSWLFDWIAAGLASGPNLFGVQCFMFVLGALTLAGAQAAGTRINAQFGGWAAPLLALMLVPRMSARPFVASWAVLAWVLWLCLRPAEEPEGADWTRSFRRRLWAVPLIALGSNFHSGAIFPSILLGIFCVEAFLLGGRRLREVVLAAAGVGALLANPGGFFNVHYVIEHLSVRSVVKLAEFQTPTLRRAYVFFVLSAVVILLAGRLWRTRPALVVSAVVFAGLGVWALRLMYDEEVIAVPLLALGVAPLLRHTTPRVVGGLVALLLVFLVANRWEWKQFVQIGPGWDEHRQPVRAAAFVRAQQLDGRMYNGFEEGGYLEWALPNLLWFQDGRVQAFPQAFFHAAEAVDESPEAFRTWIRGLGVEWAVATRLKRGLSGRDMFDAPDWAVVYWDDTSLVAVRRDVPRLAPVIARYEYRHFLPTVPLVRQIATAPKAELPAWQAELDRFEKTQPRLTGAALARCALAGRMGLGGDACDAALPMQSSEQWRKAVEAARQVPPAE